MTAYTRKGLVKVRKMRREAPKKAVRVRAPNIYRSA